MFNHEMSPTQLRESNPSETLIDGSHTLGGQSDGDIYRLLGTISPMCHLHYVEPLFHVSISFFYFFVLHPTQIGLMLT